MTQSTADDPHSHSRREQLIALLALLPVAMMGASVLTLLPLWVGSLSDTGTYSVRQVGFLASADMVGIFISSTSAFLWVRKVNWRVAALGGLSMFLLANLASATATDMISLYALRVMAGLGCGAAYAVALSALGDTPSPDWSFGLMVTAQVAFGFLGFEWLPGLIADHGINAFFHYLNAWLLLAILLAAVALPRRRQRPIGEVALSFKSIGPAAAGAFAGTVVLYIAISAVWAFMERMGVAADISPDQIGRIIGWGYLISVLGSITAPAMSRRVGRTPTMLLAMLVLLATYGGLATLTPANAIATYAATTIIFQFFWSFILPPLMATFNAVDPTGRFIVLCSPAFKLGEIIGPPMAAFFIIDSDYNGVLWLGGLCTLIGVAALVSADQRTRRESA